MILMAAAPTIIKISRLITAAVTQNGTGRWRLPTGIKLGPDFPGSAYVEFQHTEDFWMDNANILKAPAADAINLNLHYNAQERLGPIASWSAFFEVKNVLDKTNLGDWRVGHPVNLERALLAMCIALPGPGREYLARLTDSHLSASGVRAAAWLREHPGDPASNLPEDPELAGLVTELVMIARAEPASEEAMELNYLLLEQRRLEDEIAAAGERGDYERRAALSRERAGLVERIAHAQRVVS